MNLVHGTKEEHLETIKKARENNISYVWSGHLRRSPYLLENLKFAMEIGAFNTTFVDSAINQESGFDVTWYPENQKFGIQVGNIYWLQNFNEENHPDGHCITGRDQDDAWEFDTPREAQDCIDSESELEGAEVYPL